MNSRSFISTLINMDSNVWGLVCIVPMDIVTYYKEQKITRFIYSINNKMDVNRSILSMGNGQYYVQLNQEIAKHLQLRVGDDIQFEMVPDQSKYGMPLPEELSECFDIYPDGYKYFQRLSPGKQRSLLYIVAKPKRIQTRVDKAVGIMEYLEHARGDFDFRELVDWFKNNKR